MFPGDYDEPPGLRAAGAIYPVLQCPTRREGLSGQRELAAQASAPPPPPGGIFPPRPHLPHPRRGMISALGGEVAGPEGISIRCSVFNNCSGLKCLLEPDRMFCAPGSEITN